jgi:hypothetical protein
MAQKSAAQIREIASNIQADILSIRLPISKLGN